MLHSLGHQGITRESYLQIAGKTEQEIVDEARPDAEQVLRREAVIAAVIEAENIEPSEGDLLDGLQSSAAREGTTPEKLRERLDKAGRLDELREDLAQRQAIDFLAENAKAITAEQAKVREKLWTPDQEYPKGVEKPIWTPGS
jgi:trigger factor